MLSIPKIVGVMSCGFLLYLGLSGYAASAADEKKTGQAADRMGGQAGVEEKLEKGKSGAGQSADRMGGQAGVEEKLEKGKSGAGQSANRIGGQAGVKRDRAKQKGGADK